MLSPSFKFTTIIFMIGMFGYIALNPDMLSSVREETEYIIELPDDFSELEGIDGTVTQVKVTIDGDTSLYDVTESYITINGKKIYIDKDDPSTMYLAEENPFPQTNSPIINQTAKGNYDLLIAVIVGGIIGIVILVALVKMNIIGFTKTENRFGR